MSTYWVIAAGSAGRGYSRLFLRFGMAFCGDKQVDDINIGDTVILKQRKTGKTGILAAGKVVQRGGEHRGYCYENSPDKDKDWLLDIDGWDLPYWCYVDWRVPDGDEADSVPGLAPRGGTISRVKHPNPRKEADKILATGCSLGGTGYKEPEKTKFVAIQELLETLDRDSLMPSYSNEVKNKIEHIRGLAIYYRDHYGWKHNIPEHEARTFLVVPLLLALGWSEKRIKIELANVDIACFSEPYENWKESRGSCVAIIETKKFASGLDDAQRQARLYSDKFPNCKLLITTNGYCYKIYLKDEKGSFPEYLDPYDPSAYINLLNLRDKYPLNPKEGNGALDAIKWLLPNNLIQTA